MALTDPFAAYNAVNSIEAHFVCSLIQDAGIAAYVVEDVSNVGLSAWTGPLPEIHKPQVWVERADAERVKPILDEYEQRSRERRASQEPGEDVADGTIEVHCDNCEQTITFPATLRGNIELCPHCGSYVDVDDSDDEDQWWLDGDGDDEPES
jgi:Putative prokaryotic signal transducing protein